MTDKKVHLLYGNPEGLHYCQQPDAEKFTTNIFKVTCEKCLQARETVTGVGRKRLKFVPEWEWDCECPFCMGECEYEGTHKEEFELWNCKECGAAIDVPFRILRSAGVTATRGD